MATIGVTDADFFRYENVIPNLECAKICTYHHNMHDIAVLTPKLEPARYTKFYVRKDYNDGIFPKSYFDSNVSYGGRAFNPDQYFPLDGPMEKTIPNMHLYDPYLSYFSKTPSKIELVRRILNCAHVRLSTDGITPKTFNQLMRIVESRRNTGIIFHDYNLATVTGAYDIIYEVSQTRHFLNKKKINPYPVGNKFPIQIDSSEELIKWLKVLAIPNAFFLQYNGYMTDECLYYLCTENARMARQTYYNITASCSSENEFFMERLPKIFMQILFLRRQHIKILLNYDEDFIVTKEIKDLLDLFNCWLSFCYYDNQPWKFQNLARFCRQNSLMHYDSWAFLATITLSVEEIREAFQYTRERNYELFKMFYEMANVSFKGGKLENDG